MRRRNFLSLMAAAPFLSKIETWAEQKREAKNVDSSSKFYLWIHGIFGLTWGEDKKLTLVCPKLGGSQGYQHICRIGRVNPSKPDIPNDTKIVPLYPNFPGPYPYRCLIKGLNGNPSAKDTPLLDADLLVCPGQLKEDYYGLEFQLDYPLEIWPLRMLQVDIKNLSDDIDLPANPYIAMTHVLVYECQDPKKVQVVENGAKGPATIVWQGTGDRHLHLSCEPGICPDNPKIKAEYANKAKPDPDFPLKALLSCYDPISDFRLRSAEVQCAPLENVLDFCDDLREQFNIQEWSGCMCRMAPPPSQAQTTIHGYDCPQLSVVVGPNTYERLVGQRTLHRQKRKKMGE